MSLILYVGSKRYSSWSLRPYLALSHTGVPFETRTISLDTPQTKADIAAVSPAGKVPVLHDGPLVVWDSLAICEYAAELFPQAKLWPADRAKRAQARSIASEMHSGFQALRSNMPMDLGIAKPGGGRTAEVLADVTRIAAIWNDCLSKSGGPFLFGAFSNADAMFAPVATRFVTYRVELDATCSRYVATMHDVPAMKQWHADAAAEPATR